MDDALPRLLPDFLPRQRWFGAKARSILACEVEDVAGLGVHPDAALVVARVSYTDGGHERYGLLLTHEADARGLPSLGRLDAPGSGLILEAGADPDGARRLLSGFRNALPISTGRGGLLRFGDVSEDAGRMLAQDDLRISPLAAEQSNTSLRVGPYVFKMFRRLETGENPELEVGRFLTQRTSFRAMSTLVGSVTYQSPGGQSSTLGVLQTWIDNEGTGWGYVLSALGEYLRTGAAPPHLLASVTRLGEVTAEFHAALASETDVEAFAPEPLAPDDVARWSAQVLAGASRAFGLIASKRAAWPPDTEQLAGTVLSQSHLAPTIASDSGTGPGGAFHKIRIHGDYHLGQTLKTPAGFAIIDFEGEPARPLAERREKQCALKDVAGMLRSFDYALHTASDRQGDAADRMRAALGLREALVEGYLRVAATGGTWIPADRGVLDRWLTFFEFEKALYELEYEVNNRPTWVHIPLRGILRALNPSAA